jgi:hypothetical protein
MDLQGDATVVWLSGSLEPQAQSNVVEAAWRPADGTFNRLTEPLSEASARTPVVAMDAEGDTTIAWAGFNGGASIIYAASRPIGGMFTTPVALSEFLGGRRILNKKIEY